MTVRIQQEDFDIGAELTKLAEGRHQIGALASFVGLCRDYNQGHEVKSLYLEHYPALAEQQLYAIEQEAYRRWALQASLIVHRYGQLKPGDRIVLVATASAHRATAFDSCQFLIDWLKTQAAFWKAELTGQETRWVAPLQNDYLRAAKWHK